LVFPGCGNIAAAICKHANVHGFIRERRMAKWATADFTRKVAAGEMSF